MIFPDEKMIDAQVKSHTLLDAPPEFLSAYYDGFKLGAQWAINRIKSAASENFDDFVAQKIKRTRSESEGRELMANLPDIKNDYQAAVISTAAKYEEKLREKDAEIDFAKKQVDLISQAANRVSEKTCQTKAENEQLKAAVKDLLSLAELVSACTNNDCKYDISAIRCAKKHADLITKINKGEK